MNEFLFFAHVLLVVGFLYAALKLGSAALIALIALQGVFANLFVLKQMRFFGLDVTCSDVFAIGALLALNVLQEFFGKEAAKKAIRISFFASVFFVAMGQIHLLYAPSSFDETHDAFGQIFSSTPRIVFASMGVYWIVQQFDYRFFGWLKTRFGSLPLRLGLSLLLSQTLDTVLFSFIGLYGLVPSLSGIILVSLLTKWLAIGCSVPFSAFLKSQLQNHKTDRAAHE
jgi:uncharacterized integral membrane protein (TIGR00697 family)